MGKTAFVTGGRRGIGRAVAEALIKEGYSVVISGLSATSDLEFAEYLRCDNSSVDEIKRTVAYISDKYGRIDLLVNNAGTAPEERRDILSVSEKSYDRVMDANLKGTFFMCQTVAGEMIKAGGRSEGYSPRIINISSVSAYATSVERGEYCISKAGIHMVTDLFAHRLAEYGIAVFEIRPGIIMTDMTAGVREKYESLVEQGITPIKRLGRPEDVAGCVLAAISGNLDFTTGQVLLADGGFHLRRF